MSKYLKALGPAMLAAFALSAVAATAASAEEKLFHSDGKPTVLTGDVTQDNTHPHFEIHNQDKTTCTTQLYEGTVEDKLTNEITITPTYSGCTTESELGNLTTHVEMNGCGFQFTLDPGITETIEAEGGGIHTSGPVHIECEGENEITIKQTFFGFTACTIHIPAQTPTEPTVDYKNIEEGGEKHVTVTWTVEGITYTTTTGVGGENCPNHEGHDATFTGEVTVTGYKDTGKPHEHGERTDIWIQTH